MTFRTIANLYFIGNYKPYILMICEVNMTKIYNQQVYISSVQLLSSVRLFATP